MITWTVNVPVGKVGAEFSSTVSNLFTKSSVGTGRVVDKYKRKTYRIMIDGLMYPENNKNAVDPPTAATSIPGAHLVLYQIPVCAAKEAIETLSNE